MAKIFRFSGYFVDGDKPAFSLDEFEDNLKNFIEETSSKYAWQQLHVEESERFELAGEDKENCDLALLTKHFKKDKEHAVLDMKAENVRLATEKLAEYEDLEEQGLLLRLPCKVGDTIYNIEDNVIYEFIVYSFDIRPLQEFVCNYEGIRLNLKNFGKTVFLTQAEAEQKLKELRGKQNGKID